MTLSKSRPWLPELSGAALCTAAAWALRRLYALCGGEISGILFGSVNRSVWESGKALFLPLLGWGLLMLLSVRQRFHRFLPVRVCAVAAGWAAYLGLCAGFRALWGMSETAETVLTGCCALLCAALSVLLYRGGLPWERLFAPSVFVLFLLLAFYFSFTPFPLRSALFCDPETGMRGIVPPYIDRGAAALDAINSSHNSILGY